MLIDTLSNKAINVKLSLILARIKKKLQPVIFTSKLSPQIISITSLSNVVTKFRTPITEAIYTESTTTIPHVRGFVSTFRY